MNPQNFIGDGHELNGSNWAMGSPVLANHLKMATAATVASVALVTQLDWSAPGAAGAGRFTSLMCEKM